MNSILLRRLLALSLLLPLFFSASCEEKPKPRKEKPTAKTPKPKKARLMDRPIPGLSASIEEFTGAHTRVVWSEHPRRHSADTFATSNELVLKGIDTRDGRGERMLQRGLDNYSRPLLSTDGDSILFTDKEVTRVSGVKHYDPDIYRTDWEGTKPVRIAEGYAVDCWRDPATGVEWVYAARHFTATKALALEARELVRFPLDEPDKVEVIYDEGFISPDNIQFSRDGSRASGLFPWPHAGVLIRDDKGQYHAKKLVTGCWPALAPDDSGVSWVFDGGHRGATLFAPSRPKSWNVRINDGPGMRGYEMYHPRWTNHPRFLVVTGPYVPVKNATGNVINKGGASANVHLGRFSEELDKVEAWLQISDDEVSESYPDVWIDGGEEVQLANFAPVSGTPAQEEMKDAWPVVADGLVFLWHDHNSVNQIRDAAGKLHASPEVRNHGAGRFGRLEEMLLDGGSFEVDTTDGAPLLHTLKSGGDATVDMLLLPPPSSFPAPVRPIFRAPDFSVALDAAGHLLLSRAGTAFRSEAPLPPPPLHLVVSRLQKEFAASVNGAALKLAPASDAPKVPASDAITFGGGWEGGLLNVAIYQRGLTAAEVQKQAEVQAKKIAQLPPAPLRVKVSAKLVEASSMPTAEGIAPYTGALIACVYEVEQVISGTLEAKSILVKHWAMLDQKALAGFPREAGKTYELILEREDDHQHLKGERVMDDTLAFDLPSWFDVTPPRIP